MCYTSRIQWVFLLLAMVTLSGCITSRQDLVGVLPEFIIRPRPPGLGTTPEGPPEFQKGWEDGCDSGLYIYGGGAYRGGYKYTQDINMANNPEYYKAWKDAYNYCRLYVWNWSRPWHGHGGADGGAF